MALAGINLLATPGLGTILAGKFMRGLIELALSVSGFAFIIAWMFKAFFAMVAVAADTNNGGPADSYSFLWKIGVPMFAAGWLISAWSSILFIQEASKMAPPKIPTPPKLDGSAG